MPRAKIHPEVQKAMDAVQIPEVQEMMQRLAKYGLAIAVPHMHGEEGDFLPLPSDKVVLEDGLEVSFKDANDPEVQTAIAVAWRSEIDGDPKASGKCICKCSDYAFCGHHHRHIRHKR